MYSVLIIVCNGTTGHQKPLVKPKHSLQYQLISEVALLCAWLSVLLVSR